MYCVIILVFFALLAWLFVKVVDHFIDRWKR